MSDHILQSVEIQIETYYRKGSYENTQDEPDGFRTVIVNPNSTVDDYILPHTEYKEFAIRQAVHIKRVMRSPAAIIFDGVKLKRSEYVQC